MGHAHGGVQACFGNGHTLRGQASCCLRDIPAAAVVEAHVQDKAVVVSRGGLRLGQALTHFGRQTFAAPDKVQLHAIFLELGNLSAQGHREKLHEARDLIGRAVPVFRRESKNGQDGNAPLHARAYAATKRIHPLLVPRQTRQETTFGPAAVAIHDDGNVVWHHRGIRHVNDQPAPAVGAQTAMISCSLAATKVSISAICLSVNF